MALRILLIAAALLCIAPAAVCFADDKQAREAKEAWVDAKTDDARERALVDLATSNCKFAAEFLAELLEKDARARAGKDNDLTPAMRAKVVDAMCKLHAAECMDVLVAAAKEMDSDKDHALALDQCDLLTAVAANAKSDAAASAIRGLVNKQKSPWLALATVEAIRAAEKRASGAGARFHAEVLALLSSQNAKLLKCDLLAVNIFACLKVITPAEKRNAVVRALVDWQKWSSNSTPRLHDLADDLLNRLTGEACTLTDETLPFWEWWLSNNAGNKQARKPRVEYAPFVAPTIGSRTVFVLDTSSSMAWGMTDDAVEDLKKKAKEQGVTLPWDRIHTKLDLARELLIDAVNKLEPRPELAEQDRPRFAIVTYSKAARCISEGWLSADEKQKGVDLAKAIKLESTTNIQGGLSQAFRISDAGLDAEHPEYDADCVLSGAHTIVFLTDGYATWSDDSSAQIPDPNNPKGTVGDGKLVKRENILAEVARLNRFRKVRINTFGIGNYDQKLLNALATQSDGLHVEWAFKEEQKNSFEPEVRR